MILPGTLVVDTDGDYGIVLRIQGDIALIDRGQFAVKVPYSELRAVGGDIARPAYEHSSEYRYRSDDHPQWNKR